MKGMKSIFRLYQTGPLAQNVFLSLFERSKKSVPNNDIWLNIMSQNITTTHNARDCTDSIYSLRIYSLDNNNWKCMSGLKRKP